MRNAQKLVFGLIAYSSAFMGMGLMNSQPVLSGLAFLLFVVFLHLYDHVRKPTNYQEALEEANKVLRNRQYERPSGRKGW